MTMRLTLFLLLLPLAMAFGQNQYALQLYITELNTNEPLAFVNVQILPGMQGGTTDEKGKLNLKLGQGEITIRTSLLGYEDVERRYFIDRDLKVDIVLTPSGENLETVVVTDTDARELIERPQMGVERLSAGDIKSIPLILGETDVLKGLQLRSGVSSAGEASNGISVRGGTIDQNLTLLDGAPIYTPTHLFGLFSVFTPDAVSSVNLYRANIPARYGGRVASVVDVRSRNPNTEGFRMQGGIGIVSSNLAIEGPISKDGRLAFLVAGRGSFNDFAFNVIRRLKNTESRFADMTAKLRYKHSDNSIFTLSGFLSSDFYQVELINALNAVNSPLNQYRYNTLNGTLEWLRIFNDKTSWTTRIVRSDYRPDLIFPEEGGNNEVVFQSRILQYSGVSEVSHKAGSHQLSLGVQAERYQISPGELDPGSSESVNGVTLEQENGVELNAFIEDEWTVTDALTVSAGLRYSHFMQIGPGEQRIYPEGGEILPANIEGVNTFSDGDVMQTYGGFEPRLGINLQLNDQTSVKGAFALTRQYLQNIYNASTPLPTSRWKVSDALLSPQRATFLSAGVYRIAKEGLYTFGLEGYYRFTENILEYKPGADFFLEPLVETQLLQGEAEAYGIELSVEKTRGRVSGQANYTFARTFNQVNGPTFSTRINDGTRYPGYFDQPHTFNLNLVLDKGRTHELGFNLIVQSNRPYTVPNGFIEVDELTVPLFFERNNARLPVYHRLDFSWTIHNFKREKRRFVADWVVTIYNIYGRNNAYNIYFAPKDDGAGPALNGLFGNSPFASYRLSIFAAPVFSLSYKFTFK